MKLILRIVVILSAVAIVAGIAIVMVNANGGAQNSLAGFAEGDGMRRGREGLPALSNEQRPEGFPEGRFERGGPGEEDGFSAFGAAGLAKNLGIVAVIVAVYWIAEKLLGLLRSKLKFKSVGN